MAQDAVFTAKHYTRYLQEFMNKPREANDFEVLRKVLPLFFDSTLPVGCFSVLLADARSYCVICKSAPACDVDLGCKKDHVACWSCLTALIRNSYYYQHIDYMQNQCPQCKGIISPELCWQALSFLCEDECNSSDIPDEGTQAQEIRRAVSDPGLPFNCEICYDEGMSSMEVTLDCKHIFHRACLKDFFDNLVDERKVKESDIACPFCNKPIATRILQLVSPDRFEKYNEVVSSQVVDLLAEEGELVS